MNTLDKIVNKKATDPFDVLIIEKGLRAVDLRVYKTLDLMVVVLNNRKALEIKLSDYLKLKKASEKELMNWKLLYGGEGFEWEALNYDLSLKGFLKKAAIYSLHNEKHEVVT